MTIRYLPNKRAIEYGARKKHSVEDLIEIFGENLKLARKRRKLTMLQVAERAAIDRNTLREIERGNPRVGIGVYVSVLRVFNLQEDIIKLAADDELGRTLQDLDLLS